MALRNIFLNRKYKFLSYKGTICRSLSTLSHSNEHFFSKTAFIDGKYLNPWEIESNQSNHFIKYMHSKIFDTFEDHPASDNIPKIELPTTACDISKIKSIDQPHVTWIGHSTCLVQSGGVHIITDPVWSARCSPFASVGPLRRSDPALPVEDLPIDIVLLSHSHYDHLDLPTARRIGNRAIWYDLSLYSL